MNETIYIHYGDDKFIPEKFNEDYGHLGQILIVDGKIGVLVKIFI